MLREANRFNNNKWDSIIRSRRHTEDSNKETLPVVLKTTEALNKEDLTQSYKITDHLDHLAAFAMETITQYIVQITQQHNKKGTGYRPLASARPVQIQPTQVNVLTTSIVGYTQGNVTTHGYVEA